jgi:signal transduction histidine kinase
MRPARGLTARRVAGSNQTRVKATDSQPSAAPSETTGCAFRQRPDCSFEWIGPQVENLTGVPVERWVSDQDLFGRLVEDPEIVRRQVERAAASPEGSSCAFCLRHAVTGERRWIGEFRRPVIDAQRRVTAFDGVWLGLERMDEVAHRLAQAAWKEALSTVTMGVVHDFNNALTGILSLSEYFLMQVDAQHPFHEGLTLVRQNTHKAAQLAHRLLRLHHDKPGTREYRDLSQVARDLEDVLRRTIPKRIQVTCAWLAAPLPVEVDAVELQRVLVYLAQHAARAIPEHGTLRFETSFHREPPALQRFVGVQPRAAAACLAVTDSGPGSMPGPSGSGLDSWAHPLGVEVPGALALYQVKRFVEGHGGALSAESAEGTGTIFRLWLPFVNLE